MCGGGSVLHQNATTALLLPSICGETSSILKHRLLVWAMCPWALLVSYTSVQWMASTAEFRIKLMTYMTVMRLQFNVMIIYIYLRCWSHNRCMSQWLVCVHISSSLVWLLSLLGQRLSRKPLPRPCGLHPRWGHCLEDRVTIRSQTPGCWGSIWDWSLMGWGSPV